MRPVKIKIFKNHGPGWPQVEWRAFFLYPDGSGHLAALATDFEAIRRSCWELIGENA
jgi:hypothetical protein